MSDAPILLLADSGATKVSWQLGQGPKIFHAFESPGINLSTQTPETVSQQFSRIVSQELAPYPIPDRLIFYGTGLSRPEKRIQLQSLFHPHLPGTPCAVYDDLEAAARASGRAEGIACILGTGSNASYHKDYQVCERQGGLGYILGDEGSGMDLGKHLLQAMIKDQWPGLLLAKLEERMGMSAREKNLQVLRSPQPQRELAALAPVLAEFQEQPEIASLIGQRFAAFLEESVMRLPRPEAFPIDFVGGIAHHFQALLEAAILNRGLRPGKVVRRPIAALWAFHQAHFGFH